MNMPNRMIKESLRTSRNVNALTDFQFRVWIYLITYVDDFGRGSADAELLKGLVFPRRKGITEAQIADALTVLTNRGMISLYEVDGEPYFHFPKWQQHQTIRNKTSKFPAPEDGTRRAASRGKLQASDCELQADVCLKRTRREVEEEVEVEPEEELEEKGCEYSARAREAAVSSPVDDSDGDGFEKFWDAYPRKSGDIREAYFAFQGAINSGATLEQMLAALEWQTREWESEGEARFIPSPERWLRNRKWMEKRRAVPEKAESGPKDDAIDLDSLKAFFESMSGEAGGG